MVHSLYVRSNPSYTSPQSAARMQEYSRLIREQMGDQSLRGVADKESAVGRSVSIYIIGRSVSIYIS